MPPELLEEIRPRLATSRPYVSARPASTSSFAEQEWPFKLGQTVWHDKFGEGMVLAFEGSEEHTRVQVNFNNAGTKWLVMAYAKLQAR
jgi:DNA helicase-2/ATP-dependent DNA helicase PcrA